MAIATLTVDFIAQIATLQRDFDKVAQIAQRNAAKIENSFRAVGLSLGALAGGLGVGSVVAGIRNVVGAFDDLEEAAQAAGVGAVALSELRTAARLSGVDAEKLDTAITRLNVKLADAAGGGKDAQAAFRAIGVSFKDANGNVRDTEAVLRDIAGRFATFRDGAEKSALAVEFFGRSGARLVPFLNQGADGLRRFSGLSEDTVREAARMQAEFDRLSVSAERLKNSFAGALVPQFNRFYEAIQRISIVEFGKDFLISPINAALKFQNDLRLSLRTIDTLRAAIAAAGGPDTFDARDLRLRLGAAPVIPKDVTPKKEGISDASRALAEFIDGLQRQIDKTEELTAVERGLRLIRANPSLETAQVRELVQVTAERADAVNALRIEMDGLARTELARLERQQAADAADEQSLQAAVRAADELSGRLDGVLKRAQTEAAERAIEFRRAIGDPYSTEELDRLAKGLGGIRDEFDKLDPMIEGFGDGLDSALGQFSRDADIRKFFDNLARRFAEIAIQVQFITPLVERFKKALSGGGSVSGGFNFGSLFGSFGGGGNVPGTGNGVDIYGRRGTTVIYNINQIGSGVTRADVVAAMEQTRVSTIGSITDLQARGRLRLT